VAYSLIIALILSLLSLLSLWAIERSVGVGWDFHVDSVHYIQDGPEVFNGLSLISSGYYLVLYLLGFNKNIVILANCFMYVITNCIAMALIRGRGAAGKVSVWFLIFLFNPYRIHLALTPLKETLLIFCIALTFYMPRLLPINMLLSFHIRSASLVYFNWLFMKRPVALFVIALAGGALALTMSDFIISTLERSASVNLVTRSWDNVPHFQQYGIFGNFIRGLLWPLLLLSGAFFIISPAPIFFVILFSTAPALWFITRRASLGSALGVFCSLGVIAVIVPGFTSYVRYVFPIIATVYLYPLRHSRRENNR
jgi:hypothetical protein